MHSFDLNPSERKDLYNYTLELLEGYYSDTKSNRVSPVLDISEIVESVRKVDFSEPFTSKEAIQHLVEGMKNHSVHTPHPKYFGLYNPRANFPSILGDLITAVFNPQLAAWSHSPFANEIESYLIAEFGKSLDILQVA